MYHTLLTVALIATFITHYLATMDVFQKEHGDVFWLFWVVCIVYFIKTFVFRCDKQLKYEHPVWFDVTDRLNSYRMESNLVPW